MRKILIVLCLVAVQSLMAQSPEPFKGGPGDGRAQGNIIQSSVDIWLGGDGDGNVKSNYTQASTNFWMGGAGDGFAKAGYLQQVTPFWLGGAGDGFAKSGFTQPTISYWLGGNGDGYASNNYMQPTTSFWLGGAGDGHADTGYVQQSTAFWLGGAGDGWASSYRPEGPLPVRFGAFTAEKKSESQALLKWNTLSETNSSHFEIERSTNAVNFTYIDRVNASGNSTSPKDYTYTDYKVLTGNNYYRLKQVDKDGKFVYTPTRMVMFNVITEARVRIFPNPASSYVMVEWPAGAATEKTVINMMDMKGNIVKQWKMPSGMNVQSRLSVQGLPKGTYIIHIIGEKSNNLQKLLIQ
jgi:hypothetical protein